MENKRILSSVELMQLVTPAVVGCASGGILSMRNGKDISALKQLVQSVGVPDLTMVEIGVYMGQSTACFLLSGVVSRVYCVDPWSGGYDNNDEASRSDFSVVEHVFDSGVAIDRRVVKLKGTIDTVGASIGDVDIVYIDGDHTYNGVCKDIHDTIDILKPKLAISGHDSRLKSVRRAVGDLLGGADMTFSDTSWIKFLHQHN